MYRLGKKMRSATITVLAVLTGIVAGCRRASEREYAAPEPAAPAERLAFTAEGGSNALVTAAAFLVDCTPRDAGTPGAKAAAEWIAGRLEACGVPHSVDAFEDRTPHGTKTFYNVTATIDGAKPGTVVLLSHFDTKTQIGGAFAGANDGGSSTGLLLALAELYERAPLASHPTILVAFLDGEEAVESYGPHDGLHGSRRLARQLKAAKKNISGVILMDMIGDDDLAITIPHNGTGHLRALALTAADAVHVRSHVRLIDGDVLDDHQPFLDAGFPAVDLIDFTYGSAPGRNDYWHTVADTVDKLSADSLAITGSIVVEMVNAL